jgi:hypothetical protein
MFDRSHEAKIIINFLRPGIEMLGNLNVSEVSPALGEDFQQLGAMLIAWSTPIHSGRDRDGGVSLAETFQYPSPFEVATAAARRWSVGLRAHAMASNNAVANYQAANVRLPAGTLQEYRRVRAAIRSLTSNLHRSR